jgi:hypothetical protein
MRMQYAVSQVCEVTLHRGEIEEMIRDNLKARGADPSYDFASGHPFFVWDDRGGVAVRYVQEAVVAREREKFLSLKPVPTKAEIDKVLRERTEAAKSAA